MGYFSGRKNKKFGLNEMTSVKIFSRSLIENDIVFGAADSFLGLVPHKRVLGESDFVKRKLDNIPDPVILDY
jgi:hypothetical protein